MEESNPYKSPEGLAAPTALAKGVSHFWIAHLVTFHITFVLVWLALIVTNLGFAETFKQFSGEPLSSLGEMLAVGVCVWLLHTLLALAYRKMRYSSAVLTACIGSTFFLAGILLFELLSHNLPRQMSMALSWTPDYVLLPIYATMSLSAVLLFLRFRPDSHAIG